MKFKLFFYTIHLIVVILFHYSCSEEKKDIPENIIGKEKMTLMLTDLCLMEGAINIANIPSVHQNHQALKFNVYKQHNVTRAQFDSSLIYYCKHMDDFREIQSKVLEELNKKK
jgi:hypothetical protein